ncbi:MAG TPA: hypothetical protein VFB78_03360 [Acidimicrobiales bacterium]|nr:hypothetical protein [Acidimicrobiales bacterium]
MKLGRLAAIAMAAAALASCGGDDKKPTTTTVAPAPTTTAEPAVTDGSMGTTQPATTIAPSTVASFGVTAPSGPDGVSPTDGPIKSDGKADLVFRAVVSGPVSDLAVYACKADSTSDGPTIWDTFAGTRVVPPGYSYSGRPGSATWQLGVFSAGINLNAPDGGLEVMTMQASVPLDLHAADNGSLAQGAKYCLAVYRPDGTRTVTHGW